MRTVENLLRADILVENRNVRGILVLHRVQIPQLDNTEAAFGRDGYTHNRIGCGVRRRTFRRGGRQIAREHLHRRAAGNLQAVGTSTDIDTVLPQRRGVTPHHLENAAHDARGTELPQERAETLPGGRCLNLLIGIRTPGLVI